MATTAARTAHSDEASGGGDFNDASEILISPISVLIVAMSP
jgi:hypothetical protein